MDEEINRLRIALGRISRMVDRQVAGGGLTRTQMSVLASVSRAGSIGVGRLADVEGLNPTMLSRIVGKLEAFGYLERSPGIEDRRAVTVQITPAGSRMQSRLRRERTQLFTERLATLPAGQQRDLLAAIPALESLGDAMRPAESVGAGR